MGTLELRISAIEAIGFTLNGGEYSLQDIHITIQSLSDWTDEQYNTAIAQIKAHIAAHPNQYPQGEEDALLPAIKQVPQLIANIEGKSKPVATAFENLLRDIEANGGMNEVLDARANKGLIVAAAKVKEIDEEIKPVTRTMDMLKKHILSFKNDIDVKKEGTGANKVQAHRNTYAAAKEAEKQAELARLQAIADKEAERVRMTASIQAGVKEWFNEFLLAKKKVMADYFNSITLENYNDRLVVFQTQRPEFKQSDFAKCHSIPVSVKYHDLAEQTQILTDELWGNKEIFNGFVATYATEMNALRLEYIEQFPSKKMELLRQKEAADAKIAADIEAARIAEEMKHADAAKQAELAAQQAENARKASEAAQQLAADNAARIARENEAAKKLQDEADAGKAADEVAAKAAAAQAESNSLFTKTMAASSFNTSGPKRKTDQELKLLDPNGIVDAFTFWYVNEGNAWTIEKLEKKFEFIFTFATKQAANGKYLESKYAMYVDVVTAQTDKKA